MKHALCAYFANLDFSSNCLSYLISHALLLSGSVLWKCFLCFLCNMFYIGMKELTCNVAQQTIPLLICLYLFFLFFFLFLSIILTFRLCLLWRMEFAMIGSWWNLFGIMLSSNFFMLPLSIPLKGLEYLCLKCMPGHLIQIGALLTYYPYGGTKHGFDIE